MLVEDKAAILAAAKGALGERVTTVQVRQGRHAATAAEPRPDIELRAIAALGGLTASELRAVGGCAGP